MDPNTPTLNSQHSQGDSQHSQGDSQHSQGDSQHSQGDIAAIQHLDDSPQPPGGSSEGDPPESDTPDPSRTTFARETHPSNSPSQTGTVYVGASQVFSFSLSAGLDGAPPAAFVQLTITDANGQVVFTQNAKGEEDRSTAAVLLGPGAYSVALSVVNSSGPLVESANFHLSWMVLSDPIGPKVFDPTLLSQYQVPNQPDTYLYPDGTLTSNPYYWVGFAF
jgi:hypothetical protein